MPGRLFRFLVLLFLLSFAIGAAAQGGQTTYTSDTGFSLTYDDGMLFSESTPDFLNLVSIQGMVVVTYQLFGGDEVNTLVAAPSVPQTAEEYFAAYLPTLAFLGVEATPADIETVTLANGEASVLEFNQLGLNSILIAVDLSNGELVVLYGITTGSNAAAIEGMRAEALRIAEGMYYGEGAPAQPAAEETVTVRLNTPLFYSELPINTVITPGGAIFNYAPGIPPLDDGEVTDSILFSSGDDFVLLVEIYSEDAAAQIDNLKSVVAPAAAGPDYDPAADWQVLTTEQGLTAEAFTSISDESDEGTILLFVELGADHLAVLQAQATAAGRTPENEDLIVTIVDSIRLLTAEDVENYGLDATISGASAPAAGTATEQPGGETNFTVAGSAAIVGAQSYLIQMATCSDVAYNFVSDTNTVAAVSCPPGCTPRTVWGTEIYTNDSSVCSAAIHAGAITAEAGGVVLVTWLPGQDAYIGTTANGITTLDYGTWGGSMTVQGERSAPASDTGK